jgi:S1-C subfamily serine protease
MVAVLAGLIGALTASGIGMVTGVFQHSSTVIRSVIPPTLTVSMAPPSSGTTVDWHAIDNKIAPSVVGVSVSGASGEQGSGLLMIDGQGVDYVVTDRSLFAADYDTGFVGGIKVSFLTGQQRPGHLIGLDKLSGLAVIAVTGAPQIFPTFGSVSQLQNANPVMAVAARTVSGGTVFFGSVSGEDDEVNLPQGADMDNLVAVSTPPMPAAATGGPLVDQYGHVVGITLSLNPTDVTDQGLSWAVPIDEALSVARQMVDGQSHPIHPWLGVTNSNDVPPVMAKPLGLSGGVSAGQVVPGSPAGSAGLQQNDIIYSFAGHPVNSTGSLTALVLASQPGAAEAISFIHNGKPLTRVVHITKEPNDS